MLELAGGRRLSDRPRRTATAWITGSLVVLCLATAACRQPARDPGGDDQPRQVIERTEAALDILFMGNSLTAYNDLPNLVRDEIAKKGQAVRVRGLVIGGASLEEFWNRPDFRKVLEQEHWDYLVLQQGPSTRPESQEHLATWARRWAEEARRYRTRPALFMVWPPQDQANGFALVAQAYRQAAASADALLLPVGEAWQAAGDRDQLYGFDRFHPSRAGSLRAAEVIARTLMEAETRSKQGSD